MKVKPVIFTFLVSLLFLHIAYGCVPLGESDYEPTRDFDITSRPPDNISETQKKFVDIEFRVEVPVTSDLSQSVSLDILDEVTGLAFNILRYTMKREDLTHYSVTIPFLQGSVLKYRYVRDQSPTAVEYTSGNVQVRYRLYHVTGKNQVNDLVAAWTDTPYTGDMGRVQGQLTDAVSHLPIPNILISAGGQSVITASDGSFLMDGLSLGVHNLVTYSLDGRYLPFSQGVQIAAGATTPVPIQLIPARTVKVTFSMTPPAGSVPGVPIRMVGNTISLGNTFADLEGGMSVLASRSPLLTPNSDGTYSITIELPVGMDFQYKYTIGDGFWNAEHGEKGEFIIRQLIIPDDDTMINDQVISWASGSSGAVSFSVKAPGNTLPGEVVSIQFNPYAWTPPLPMWPLGDGQWLYILYSPMDLLGDIGYRFCRNDQCTIADDIATHGKDAKGPIFSAREEPQAFQVNIQSWVDWPESTETSNVVIVDIKPRGDKFIAGIEYEPSYRPSWNAYQSNAIRNIREIGANWIILTPTWGFINNNPPVLTLQPGVDPYWDDTWQQIHAVKQNELKVALYPMTRYPDSMHQWWQDGIRDDGWWQSWFDRYRTFLINFADLAQESGADAIILGEPAILPALPDGKLANSKSSGISLDANAKWKKIIREVHNHFDGLIIWSVPYPFVFEKPYSFLDEVDGIYVLYAGQLGKGENPSASEITNKFSRSLAENIQPMMAGIGKSIIIGINYPSIDGAASGCIRSENNCLKFENLSREAYLNLQNGVDIQEQMDIYNAILLAINQSQWIDGFISRGYFPPVPLKDKSPSIHGKPAADVLWYWFPRILSEPKNN